MTELSLRPRAFAKAILHALKYPHRPVFGVLLAHSEGIPEEEESVKPGPVSVEDAWSLFHSPPTCVPMLELSLIQVDELCQRQKLRVVGLYAANQPSSSGGKDGEEEDSDNKSTKNSKSSSKTSSELVESGSSSSRSRSLLPQELLKIASANSYLLVLDTAGLKQALNPEEGLASSPVDQSTVFEVYSRTGSSSSWQRVVAGKGASTGGKAEGEKAERSSKSEIEPEGKAVAITGIAFELVQEYAKAPWRIQDEFADFEDHLEDISRDWLNKRILQ